MPGKSPKHRVDRQDPGNPAPVYHNRRQRKYVIVGVTLFAIAGILLAWHLVATWPDVWPGDTVRIRYNIWTINGTWIEGSDDLTVYVDVASSPHAIFIELAHARVGELQDFAVAACPSASIPCQDFAGYTSGPHAWEAIKGNVTILEILNR